MLDLLRYAHYLVHRSMAYRVTINNVQIEADTLAEVMELLKQSPPIAPDGKLQLPAFGWTTHSVARFLDSIKTQEKQLVVLYTLKSDAPQGLLKEELAKRLEMSAQQLGGVLAGISKNAKKLNSEPPIEIEHTLIRPVYRGKPVPRRKKAEYRRNPDEPTPPCDHVFTKDRICEKCGDLQPPPQPKARKTCRYSLRHDFVEAWAQLEIDIANQAAHLLHTPAKRKSK